jgi:hypothetical protein
MDHVDRVGDHVKRPAVYPPEVIRTVAAVALATPAIMRQSCPPEEFYLGCENARLLMSALRRMGYVIFKTHRQ